MKKFIYTTLTLIGSVSILIAQQDADQNPNYKKSLSKYETKKDDAYKQQSTTIHETYKVKDWNEIKAERKALKETRKHELRKLRLEGRMHNRIYRQPRYRNNRRYYNEGYYNNYNPAPYYYYNY